MKGRCPVLTRAAILIESSNIPRESDLPGARLDVTNWRQHLCSDYGGAWDAAEITILNTPTWASLKGLLSQHSNTDYVFIIFSGHGYHVVGKDIDETRICLTGSDEIPVASVNPGNPRCTFVVDSCRGVVREEDLSVPKIAMESLMQKTASSRDAYRRTFDQAIQQCERGVIRLYSCDLEESAHESSRSGGYFSTFLMACCDNWHDRTSERSYYPMDLAHRCAAGRTTGKVPQQHPQYEGGRRRKHFPLAVYA